MITIASVIVEACAQAGLNSNNVVITEDSPDISISFTCDDIEIQILNYGTGIAYVGYINNCISTCKDSKELSVTSLYQAIRELQSTTMNHM